MAYLLAIMPLGMVLAGGAGMQRGTDAWNARACGGAEQPAAGHAVGHVRLGALV